MAISRSMKASSPVFIVGEARSGTSILYRTLLKHPSFRTREENLHETNIIVHASEAALFRPGRPTRLWLYMMKDVDQYRRFVRTIAVLRPLLRVMLVVRRRLPTWEQRLWRVLPNHLIVRAFFHYARIARGSQRVLEKTPHHIRHLRELQRCFPQAKFLYIHRHPVDVLSSYRRRMRIDPRSRSWSRVSVAEFVELYRRHTALALDAARRHPDAMLLIRYEDFTAEPDATLREVCAFVDEPFDEATLELDPQPPAVEEVPPNKRSGPGWSRVDPHLFGEIVPSTKSWRDHLKWAEARRVENRLEPLMRELGYSRYTRRRPPKGGRGRGDGAGGAGGQPGRVGAVTDGALGHD